jgi:hypothetical protein
MSASSNPITSSRVHKPKSATPSVSVARLAAIDGEGRPWVTLAGDPSDCPLPARHTCPIGPTDVGREVVLALEDGDPMKPIILGLLQAAVQAAPVQLSADGQDLTVQAERQIILQCGKASITLTRAGKVLIRGAYVSTRSSGVNRIKGGSVQIN